MNATQEFTNERSRTSAGKEAWRICSYMYQSRLRKKVKTRFLPLNRIKDIIFFFPLHKVIRDRRTGNDDVKTQESTESALTHFQKCFFTDTAALWAISVSSDFSYSSSSTVQNSSSGKPSTQTSIECKT